MPRAWRVIRSFFTAGIAGRRARPAPVPVVALVVDEEDRNVLAAVSGREPLKVHFAESCEETLAVASRLSPPVILLDRDWPGIEWRPVVERLSASPHRACVILMSGVSDDYLLQEVIRRGGYDILSKPLRAENVARLVKLALSYWNSAPKSAAARK